MALNSPAVQPAFVRPLGVENLDHRFRVLGVLHTRLNDAEASKPG